MIDLDRIEEMAGTFAPEGWVRTYVPALVAELRAAREAHAKLVAFHDSYDPGSDDRFKVRGRIFRILAEWDRAVK